MGSSLAEFRPLIFIITFMSTFLILTTAIPSGFLVTGYEEYRLVEVPEYFDEEDILAYDSADMVNFTIQHDAYGAFIKYFTLGGWSMKYSSYKSGENYEEFSMTYDHWWIFEWNHEFFTWYDEKGRKIGTHVWDYDLDKLYDEFGELKFKLMNSKTQYTLWLAWNTTKYDTPSEALANNEMYVLCGIKFDKVNTSVNAWQLIGMLLFFQMPDVHWAINALIAIPLWVGICYLVYVLIVKVIPFVAG